MGGPGVGHGEEQHIRLIPTQNGRFEGHRDAVSRSSLKVLSILTQASVHLSKMAKVTASDVKLALGSFTEVSMVLPRLSALPTPTPSFLL